jgi:hypothetical protein
MGETPRKRDITIEFDCQFRVDLQGMRQYYTCRVLHVQWV